MNILTKIANWYERQRVQRVMDNFSKDLFAVERGDEDAVKKVLKDLGRMNEKNKPAYEMIMKVAAQSGQTAIIEMLLEHGVDAEGARYGFTPAEAALKAGHSSTVKVLYNHVVGSGRIPSETLKNAFNAAQEDTRDSGNGT